MNSPHSKTSVSTDLFRMSCRAIVQKASFVRLSLGRGLLLEGSGYYLHKYQNVDNSFEKCQVHIRNQYRQLLLC